MAGKPDSRIFLDSNVLISGVYSPSGAPARILFLHASGEITIVVSQLVLSETVLTLQEKAPAALSAFQAFLLSSPPEVIVNPPLNQVTKWIRYLHFADAVIFAAAISAEPDYFVTGDKHFYASPALPEKSGLCIVTPNQLIKSLKL